MADFSAQNGWQNSEEHIQTTFTIKLLELLGWSGSNWVINQGQDVNTGKKPDILLIDDSKNTLLVVESKDAKKSDKLDGKYANKTFEEQLYKYCEAEGVQWGILTNFVEWRIYSIYQKRIYKEKRYAFHDLLWPNADKSRYIDLLSTEGLAFLAKLQKGELTRTHGRWDDDTVYYPKQEEIKAEFFAKLKNWRAKLRTHFQKQHGKEYTLYQIDLMTQRIIDRLIFVDYCADNHVIPQDKLHAILHSKSEIYEEVKKIFRQMDEKFNSELFMLAKSDKLCVPDEVIRPIIEELAAIDFTRLSVHVIGEVYENYLSELLRQSKGGIVVEDEKASKKKKSQGIYYTPDYIVDYIVSRTVGERLAKCKTEAEVAAVKVLDPACGSGSFLIRVFDEFLKHYKRVTKDGGIFEFELRKKILTQNLYGVDLDEKAVEITKLNLMIKALEGIGYQDLSGRKLIPNLKLNIRCGNSLIGGEQIKRQKGDNLFDNYKSDLARLTELRAKYHTNLTDEAKQKVYAEIEMLEEKVNMELNKELEIAGLNPEAVRAFNYSVAFPDVMNPLHENPPQSPFAKGGSKTSEARRAGGFDVVVGNPPWVSLKGKFGNQICTNEELRFFTQFYGGDTYRPNLYEYFVKKAIQLTKQEGLNSFIIPDRLGFNEQFKEFRSELLKTGHIQSLLYKAEFPNITADTLIYVYSPCKPNGRQLTEIGDFGKETAKVKQSMFEKIQDCQFLPITSVVQKLYFDTKKLKPLNQVVESKVGFIATPKSISEERTSNSQVEVLKGRNIGKYYSAGNFYFEFSKNNLAGGTQNQTKLSAKEKILIRKTGYPLPATIDISSRYPEQSLYFLLNPTDEITLKYLLGVINSNIFRYTYWNWMVTNKEATPQLKKIHLDSFPVRIIDFSNSLEKSKHDDIVKLVDQLLELNKTATSRTENAVRIRALESKVDDLVFELYGLSEEERRVVLTQNKQ